jgi:hypothetical protein
MAISVLNEIKDLPQKVTDPNWLKELERTARNKAVRLPEHVRFADRR